MNFYVIAIHWKRDSRAGAEQRRLNYDWLGRKKCSLFKIPELCPGISCTISSACTHSTTLALCHLLYILDSEAWLPLVSLRVSTVQASSAYSCVILVTAGSYCSDNTVIRMEGNQRDSSDTRTVMFFFFAGVAKLISRSTRLFDGYECLKTLSREYGTWE